MPRTLLITLAFSLAGATAHGQCFCASITIEVVIPKAQRGDHNTFRVERGTKEPGSDITLAIRRDSLIELRLQTGGGIDHHEWTIRSTGSGEVMHIHLYNMEYDTPYPTFRMPFTPGSYAFDQEELRSCFAGSAWPSPTEISTFEIGCKGGRLLGTMSTDPVRFTVLDMQCFVLNAK